MADAGPTSRFPRLADIHLRAAENRIAVQQIIGGGDLFLQPLGSRSLSIAPWGKSLMPP